MRRLAPLTVIAMATAGLLVAHAAPAAAEPGVGVVVTGEPTLQPALAAQLEGWLRERNYPLVPSPLPPGTVNTVIDCLAIEDDACAQAAITATSRAGSVIYVRVEAAPGSDAASRVFVMTAHKFEIAGPHQAERRRCDECTDDKLHGIAAEAMAALLGDGALPAAPTARRPLLTPPAPRPSRLRSRRTGVGLFAAGGAALVTGGILVALDEDPDSIPTDQKRYRNTVGFGLGVAITGAIVASVGAVLFATAPSTESANGSPTASVGADGFVVGWTGGF